MAVTGAVTCGKVTAARPHRRRRPRWVLVGAAVVLGAAACACGATGGDDDELTVLRVVLASDWASASPVVDAVRDFEADHRGVRVDIQGVLFEFVGDTVKAARGRGQPPDVAQGHAFAAGAQGLAVPLDGLWRDRLKEADYLPGAVEDVTWAGHRYGVPLDTNAMLLLYDAQRLAEAGLSPPGEGFTFTDLERTAAAVSTADGTHRGIGLPSSTWHTYGWVRANGGEVVDVGGDGRAHFTLDAPAVVQALGGLAGLVQRGLAFPPAGVTGDRTDAFDLFRSGSAAMHATGSWDLATLRQQPDSSRYGVAVLPYGPGSHEHGTAMGGSSLYVPKGSKQRDLAFDFMLHLTSDRYALRLAREEGRLPVRLRVYRDAFFQTPDLRTFLSGLKTAHPFLLEAFPEAHRAFADAIDKVLSGRSDAATALHDAQLKAQASAPS